MRKNKPNFAGLSWRSKEFLKILKGCQNSLWHCLKDAKLKFGILLAFFKFFTAMTWEIIKKKVFLPAFFKDSKDASQHTQGGCKLGNLCPATHRPWVCSRDSLKKLRGLTMCYNTKRRRKMKKLKELILYVSELCKDDPEYGATKLNKILFVVDFMSYSIYGNSITGSTYFHLPKGPAPKEMVKAQEQLIAEGRATIEERPYYGRIQKRLVALTVSDTTIFSPPELALVRDGVTQLRGIGATDLSNWTHTLTAWVNTRDREVIPYHTVFDMYRVPVRRDGVIWGQKELDRLSKEAV